MHSMVFKYLSRSGPRATEKIYVLFYVFFARQSIGVDPLTLMMFQLYFF